MNNIIKSIILSCFIFYSYCAYTYNTKPAKRTTKEQSYPHKKEKTQAQEQAEARAVKIIKKALSLQRSAEVYAEEIIGGRSGAQIFKVIHISEGFDTKQWIIRFLPKKPTEAEALGEIAAVELASKEGYGPRIHSINTTEEGQHYILMDFIQGEQISFDARKKYIIKLARLLRTMHYGTNGTEAQPNRTEESTKKFSTIEFITRIRLSVNEIEHYPERNLIKRDKDICISIKERKLVEKNYEILKKELDSDMRNKTTCHNDLHPGNLMVIKSPTDNDPNNSEFKVIDYGKSAFDDPFFDVATIAIFYCSERHDSWTIKNEIELLTEYLQRLPNGTDQKRLEAAKKLVLIRYGLSNRKKANNLPCDLYTLQNAPEEYIEYIQKIFTIENLLKA